VPALLVFGARNLGRAIGKHLAAQGWDAAAFATSDSTIDRFRAEIPGAIGFTGDAARDGAAVESALAATQAHFGSLDLIVNAVGARPRGAFGGGGLLDTPADALEPYVDDLLPAVLNVLRLGARALDGSGTIVQITGGSSRRAMGGRGPWAAGAFATRALTQAAALELREQGVHVALLIVDATIESEKSADRLRGQEPDASTTEEDVAGAVAYLASQSPRAWTHELTITPRLDRWVP
jgi:NAD(P)-dependent dehydrogenase (short-subunit alcohol dehydrogenase family)